MKRYRKKAVTHPKLANCHDIKQRRAVRLSSEVMGERYADPTIAKICKASKSVKLFDDVSK